MAVTKAMNLPLPNIEMCTAMCTGMRVGMCTYLSVDMCADVHIDKCACIDMCRDV